MNVQELYDYKAAGVSSTTVIAAAGGNSVFGGFLCTIAGNFCLKDASDVDIISVIGVVVGQFIAGGLTLPLGGKVVLSGGAAGTIYIGR